MNVPKPQYLEIVGKFWNMDEPRPQYHFQNSWTYRTNIIFWQTCKNSWTYRTSIIFSFIIHLNTLRLKLLMMSPFCWQKNWKLRVFVSFFPCDLQEFNSDQNSSSRKELDNPNKRHNTSLKSRNLFLELSNLFLLKPKLKPRLLLFHYRIVRLIANFVRKHFLLAQIWRNTYQFMNERGH